MSVFDEQGLEHELFSLWKARKCVVAFTRHMGCRFCKEQVALLEKIKMELSVSDVSPIIITIGCYRDIPKFRKETNFSGEIYVDADLTSQRCYKLLKFASGPQCLFVEHSDQKVMLPETLEAAKRASAFSDGGYGSGENPFTGDILQIGGISVLGPGNSCDYFFRSSYVGDLADMHEVAEMATGRKEGGEEIIYPSAVEWNKKMITDTELTVPLGDNITEGAVSCMPVAIQADHNLFNSSTPAAEPSNHISNASTMPTVIAAVLCGLLVPLFFDESMSTVFRVVATVCIALCLYYLVGSSTNAVTTNSQCQSRCPFAHLSVPTSPDVITKQTELRGRGTEFEVQLMSISEVDKRILTGGPRDCACGFMKNINMDTIQEIQRGDSNFASQYSEEVKLDENSLVPLESTLCYVREFLAKPNPSLGRKGPTCPFVPKSLKLDSLYFAVVPHHLVPNSTRMESFLRTMLERFLVLEPVSGKLAPFKAIIMIFSELPPHMAPRMIDAVQKRLKPLFVEHGLMLGEFHQYNNACGLHNKSFFPLRTPFPCLAIRHMVPSDIVFLNDAEISKEIRITMVERFLGKFGDSSSSNDAQTTVARDLLDKLRNEDTR